MPTPKQKLLEVTYPGDLPTDIRDMQTAGFSWRTMAAAVSEKAGVEVTHESLRSWYGQPVTNGTDT